jgi:hypothetical protein
MFYVKSAAHDVSVDYAIVSVDLVVASAAVLVVSVESVLLSVLLYVTTSVLRSTSTLFIDIITVGFQGTGRSSSRFMERLLKEESDIICGVVLAPKTL